MTEHPNTILYGIGNVAKELAPASWEARAKKVLEEKIIPKASPAWQARLEKHKAVIAKTTGWVITGAEVGIVAGVTYTGVKFLKKSFGKHPGAIIPQPFAEIGHTAQRPVHIPVVKAVVAPTVPVTASEVANMMKRDLAQQPDLTWLKALSGEIRPVPLPVSSFTFGDPVLVTDTDVPLWLRNLSPLGRDPSDAPSFVQKAIAQRIKMKASEATAALIDPIHPESWWIQRGIDGFPVHRIRKKSNSVKKAQSWRVLQRNVELATKIKAKKIELRNRQEVTGWMKPLILKAHSLVHDRGDEVTASLIDQLRHMPDGSTPERMEKQHIARQLITRILDQMPAFRRQFGHQYALDGIIATKAADWVAHGMKGIKYMLRS